jgi:hypothetical protein
MSKPVSKEKAGKLSAASLDLFGKKKKKPSTFANGDKTSVLAKAMCK